MTTAVCSAAWRWADNSNGQDPCQLDSLITASCVNSCFSCLAKPGHMPLQYHRLFAQCCVHKVYGGIFRLAVSTFSLSRHVGLMIVFLRFTAWTLTCSTVVPNGTLPKSYGEGYDIPQWATLPLGFDDTWNLTAATLLAVSKSSTPETASSSSLPDTESMSSMTPSTNPPTTAITAPSLTFVTSSPSSETSWTSDKIQTPSAQHSLSTSTTSTINTTPDPVLPHSTLTPVSYSDTTSPSPVSALLASASASVSPPSDKRINPGTISAISLGIFACLALLAPAIILLIRRKFFRPPPQAAPSSPTTTSFLPDLHTREPKFRQFTMWRSRSVVARRAQSIYTQLPEN
ncbi:hypothetical protein FA95DRAFT_1575665 [Auriscalpium vulgare]|uniref:Uncharacterized protein n=1 Tax=Auriscalpium vulgare TaxID=40419 RepID=A0ACB8RFA4_9AGAM|nr:hypothetical protein FA95DRAFT_1575665 [Auriscalpium vulgare]